MSAARPLLAAHTTSSAVQVGPFLLALGTPDCSLTLVCQLSLQIFRFWGVGALKTCVFFQRCIIISMVFEARAPFFVFQGPELPPAGGPGPKICVFETPGLSPKESKLQNRCFLACRVPPREGPDTYSHNTHMPCGTQALGPGSGSMVCVYHIYIWYV